MADLAELNLRATLAMRAEDLRIARKHEREAAERVMNAENHGSYLRAVDWANYCRAREEEARSRLIRHLSKGDSCG